MSGSVPRKPGQLVLQASRYRMYARHRLNSFFYIGSYLLLFLELLSPLIHNPVNSIEKTARTIMSNPHSLAP
jgi:hypothetical protein